MQAHLDTLKSLISCYEDISNTIETRRGRVSGRVQYLALMKDVVAVVRDAERDPKLGPAPFAEGMSTASTRTLTVKTHLRWMICCGGRNTMGGRLAPKRTMRRYIRGEIGMQEAASECSIPDGTARWFANVGLTAVRRLQALITRNDGDKYLMHDDEMNELLRDWDSKGYLPAAYPA
ncbi:hypothetical protein C8Q80DRAFT_1166116 [Daedaleopsis nitida]|nr:hypothetical protein C8Q80DRAFT_1166116 [Daedaleopsis nitida]